MIRERRGERRRKEREKRLAIPLHAHCTPPATQPLRRELTDLERNYIRLHPDQKENLLILSLSISHRVGRPTNQLPGDWRSIRPMASIVRLHPSGRLLEWMDPEEHPLRGTTLPGQPRSEDIERLASRSATWRNLSLGYTTA